MSCPDWVLLTARREREGADPEGWGEAVEHLDACPQCRREALKTDPLLIFQRLPVVAMTPAEERGEVAAVREAVAAMRTARRLETPRSLAGWRRWAAAAALAAVALSVSRDKAPRLASAAMPPKPSVTAPTSAPALEELNSPEARVYQMAGEGISVFMIVDANFDDSDV